MKRAKLVQLLSKDDKGLYKKDGQQEVLRSGVKVPDEIIAQYENDYPETGRLYVVIEEDTVKPIKEEIAKAKADEKAKKEAEAKSLKEEQKEE